MADEVLDGSGLMRKDLCDKGDSLLTSSYESERRWQLQKYRHDGAPHSNLGLWDNI